MEIKKVSFDSVFIDPARLIRPIDPENVAEKKASLLAYGYFDPIKVALVTSVGDDGGTEHKWAVTDGGNRYTALTEIRAEKPEAFEEILQKGQITINVQKGDLESLRDISNASNAYARPLTPPELYLEIVRMSHANRDQREIGEALNLQQPRVNEFLSFQRVIAEAHAKWREGVLKTSDMINLAALKEEDQVGALQAFIEGIAHEGAGGKAQSRKALRKAAEEKGGKRQYVNKGKPTRAKLASYVPRIAVQAKNAKTAGERAFYNALAAAFKVVNGEVEFEKVSFDKEYVTEKDAKAAEKLIAEQEEKARLKAEKAAARAAKKAEKAKAKGEKKAKAPKAEKPKKAAKVKVTGKKAPIKKRATKKKAA
jgi:ParB-like chromosome segregation protein Spo0J